MEDCAVTAKCHHEVYLLRIGWRGGDGARAGVCVDWEGKRIVLLLRDGGLEDESSRGEIVL